jgi:hypothetical protein
MAGGVGDIITSNIQGRFSNKRRIAEALQQQASQYQPLNSPFEVLAKIATGGLAGYAGRRERQQEEEAQKNASDILSKALMGNNVDYGILGQNQDTAGLGLNLKVDDINRQRNRQNSREDQLASNGLQIGPDGNIGFLPGYLESQQKLNQARSGPSNQFTDVTDNKGNVVFQRDSSGRLYPVDQKSNGILQGSGFEQQALNYLLQGDSSTPEYAAVYNQLGAPRTTIVDGKEVTINPNMSAFRKPTFTGYGQPPQADSQQPTSQLGAQVPPQNGSNITVKDVAGLNKNFDQETKQAADFTNRLEQANAILNDLGNKGVNAQSVGGSVLAGLGDKLGFNLRPTEFQQQEQAQRAFVNATLRRESGATISPAEFESATKQYFPQPGDSPEVIQQKAQNRLLVIQGLKTQSGQAYRPLPNSNTTTTQNNNPSTSPGKVRIYDPATKTFRDQ